MNKKILYAIVAVLIISTALFTIFAYVPEKRINTNVEVLLDTPIVEEIDEENIDIIEQHLSLEREKTSTYIFSFLNRELPRNWQERKLYLQYTFVGNYNENSIDRINELLQNEYSWRTQLDKNGDVVFNGPLLRKDGRYQLHVHNTLYRGTRNYLMGDILDWLWYNDNLIGTQIDISGLVLEAKWTEDIYVLEDNYIDNTADLIISTCLERDGQRRLVIGFDILTE